MRERAFEALHPVLSPDAQQTWLYVADGTNHKVWILRRSDLEIVGEFGRGGRQLGQFLRPHGMSVDAQGNLYVGEASTGRRVQRFLLLYGGMWALGPLVVAIFGLVNNREGSAAAARRRRTEPEYKAGYES